jgi:hypothetical protein
MVHGIRHCAFPIASPRAAARWLVAAPAASGVVGCGGGGRPKAMPTHGQTTYAGGDWPAGGLLRFLPIEPADGYPRRPATVKFETDGNFTSPTLFEPGDDVVPGRYTVFVDCWKVKPTPGWPPSVGCIAEKCQRGATTDFEAEITADSAGKEFHGDFPPNKSK